jgi:hypothetical protein
MPCEEQGKHNSRVFAIISHIPAGDGKRRDDGENSLTNPAIFVGL